MPRRTPRIGVGIKPGGDLAIGKVGRARIEKAFGYHLTPEVWKQVELWTSFLTMMTPVENNAAPITQTSKKLGKLIQSALSLREDLTPEPREPLPPGVSIKDIYLKYFEVKNIGELTPDNTYFFLQDIIDGIIALSEFMQSGLKNDLQGFHEGFAWELWVQKLTQIFTESGLPVAASKDASKRKHAAASPFVTFIYEIQKEIPRRGRRPENIQSISTAIYRARK